MSSSIIIIIVIYLNVAINWFCSQTITYLAQEIFFSIKYKKIYFLRNHKANELYN